METIAYGASILIGVTLGLIGGGGSILTLPVLVYLFGINPILATSYSLFVVGTTSLVGAIGNFRKGLVSLKTAVIFGGGSILTVFLTRKFLVPNIPQRLVKVGELWVTSDILTMVFFAVLMVFAALSMIRSGRKKEPEARKEDQPVSLVILIACGIGIGLATGLFGAGGGFLLIPTLVLLVGLSMKKAVGTSLLIIAMNSLIGFTGDLGHFVIDWLFLLKVTISAVAGIFIGGLIGQKMDGSKLKVGFGWFVLVMGIYIIYRELFFK